MPLYKFRTLDDIRRDIGKLIGAVVVLQGATLDPLDYGHLIHNRLLAYNDDTFNGAVLYAPGYPDPGIFSITDSFRTSGTIAISPTTTPSAITNYGQTLEIWKTPYSPFDVNEAINNAIISVGDTYLVPYLSTPTFITSDSVAGTLVASLPTQLAYFSGVHLVATSGIITTYEPIGTFSEFTSRLDEDVCFATVEVSTTTIYISNLPSGTTTDQVGVRGYVRPELPPNGASAIAVRPDYLAYMGAYLVESTKMEGTQLDPEDHSSRAGNWLRMALMIRETMNTRIDPNTVEVNY